MPNSPKRDQLQAQLVILVDRAARKQLTPAEAAHLRSLVDQATAARRSLAGEVRRLQHRLTTAHALTRRYQLAWQSATRGRKDARLTVGRRVPGGPIRQALIEAGVITATDTIGDAIDKIRAQGTALDGAYRERAHLVALLAAIYPSVMAPAPDVDEDGWHIVYVYLHGQPDHQLSWHIHPRDLDLFGRVERVAQDDERARWDGHSTATKYVRIRLAAADLDRR